MSGSPVPPSPGRHEGQEAPAQDREIFQDPEPNGPLENRQGEGHLEGFFANFAHQPDPPLLQPNIFPASFIHAVLLVTFDGFRENLQQQTIQLEQIQPIEGLNEIQKNEIKTQLERIKGDLDIYGRVVNETMIKFEVEDGQMEFDENVVEFEMDDDMVDLVGNREDHIDLNNNSEEEQA